MNPNIVNADVRYSGFRAVFSFIDPDSLGTADVTVNTSDIISQPEQVNDSIQEMSHKWATFEPNLWRLDGSFDLIPDDLSEVQTGWWSESMCDESGEWQVNPTIDLTFPEPITSIGVTVTFDTKANEFAEDFTISIYDELGELLVFDEVTGNTLANYVSENPYENAVRISVEIRKWHNGHRHARISEISAGIIEEYTKSSIVSASIINETNLLSESVISGELSMEIDNMARRFNFMNPRGLYRYLVDAYPIDVSIGLGTTADVEYIRCGRYYFYKSETSENEISAKIYARDRLYTLDLSLYRKGELTTISAYDFVVDILTDAGQSGYFIDSDLKNVQLTKSMPLVSHREAIRLVAQASGAIIWVDRDDIIRVERKNIGAVAVIYNEGNCIESPKPSIDEYINTADAVIHSYIVDSVDSEIVNTTVTVNGTSEFWLTYSSPATNVSVQVTGASLVSAERYLYAAKITLTGNATATITLTGKKVSDNESLYRIDNGKAEVPRIYEVNNSLITSVTIAQNVAEWSFAMKQYRLLFDIHWRGDPSINIGDTCEIHDRYSNIIRAITTRHELSYDGTFSEITQAKGGW